MGAILLLSALAALGCEETRTVEPAPPPGADVTVVTRDAGPRDANADSAEDAFVLDE